MLLAGVAFPQQLPWFFVSVRRHLEPEKQGPNGNARRSTIESNVAAKIPDVAKDLARVLAQSWHWTWRLRKRLNGKGRSAGCCGLLKRSSYGRSMFDASAD
jgi:hypothetical protein